MRRHPAAVSQWTHDQRNRPAVRELEGFSLGKARRRLSKGGGDILIGIAFEMTGRRAVNEDFPQRRPRAEILRRQPGHFDVAAIADDEPGGAVEHAQPLRHIVDRHHCGPAVSAFAGNGEQSSNRQSGEREQHGHAGRDRYGGEVVQYPDDSVEAEPHKPGDADCKADRARGNDHAPPASGFSHSGALRHRRRPCERIKPIRANIVLTLMDAERNPGDAYRLVRHLRTTLCSRSASCAIWRNSPRCLTKTCNKDLPPQPSLRSNSSTALSSTWAPAAHSSKLVDSASLCEIPPAQGTKIMVVGATRAT